ncbi:MAG: hypothetical protein OEV30_01380 [Ignavibacteria bacterium]|nr:hypothetical protein [Ignavibacteria bacterium]
MSPDEKPDPREVERQKLLEEIRQRAEEAELKRIELEEKKSGTVAPEDEQPQEPAGPPVAVDQQPTPQPKRKNVDEHRLIDLRGRFAVAVDHDDIDEASDILLDLAGLIPDTVELTSYQNTIRALRKKLREAREVPAPPPVRDERSERERLSLEKKANALMEESTSLYEQEKYDKAATTIGRLLELDPENEDAVDLQSRIVKAQELAAEVRAEEERWKAEEVVVPKVEPEQDPEPEIQEGGDFWGNEEIPHSDGEYGLQIDEEEGAAQPPPRRPLTQRIVERASGITIPVKPIAISLVMILAVVGGYFLAREIQVAAAKMDASVLILPGWHTPSDTLAAYLSYAVLEQVTAALSSTPGLRVIAPQSASSVQYIKGGPAAAARSLQVEHYLHWKIATTPASVTFDLTLRDTGAVDPLWTSRRQSSIRELPAAAAEIATSILIALELRQEGGRSAIQVAGMSSDEDALLDYFRGRLMVANRERFSVRSAGLLFDKAIRTDPAFRMAKVGKAWTLLLEADASLESPRSLLMDAGRYLTSAGDEGATSPAHFSAIGLSEQLQGRFEKAKTFYDAGVKFFPGDPELRRRAAILCFIRGESDDARAHADAAVELDPLNSESFLVRGTVSRHDDVRAALADYRRAARLSPDRHGAMVSYLPELLVDIQQHDSAAAILTNEIGRTRDDYLLYYRLGRVYQAAGKPISQWGKELEKAQTLLNRHLAADPGDGVARSYLALVLTRLGKQKEAEVELNRALRDRRDHTMVLYNAARAYTMQRNEESALEYLDKAVGVRYNSMMIADMDFFNLRNQSAFQAVVTR